VKRVLRKVERALPDLPRRRFAVVAGANRWREILAATTAFVRPGAGGPDVVRELERDFAAAAGTRFAFAFGAGRMALYVLLEALGLKAGDEVVVPGFTCAVVPNALVYRGLVPVYADIEPVTFNVDPRCVAERVTPRTRALYLQHTFGVTGPVEELRAIADRHGLVIVEDCAHSLGARHRGRPHGSLSDAAFFSLDRTKVVNSHSGGVVATDDEVLAARLSELQAALPLPGTSQVRRMLFTFAAECALHAPGLYWLGRPAWALLWRTLLLRDYNTAVVVVSVAALGAASGLIGSFLLLRKRALMGDALSHATLPGIALAFMLMAALGASGKSLIGLLAGATVFGLLGVACAMLITRYTRLKDDAALGIVLSVFFGVGVALVRLASNMPEASAAGLESFIYGKAASIVFNDMLLILIISVIVAAASAALYKELALLCFDDGYAASQGWPVGLLDALMLALVTAVTVIGLQAVGLILIIAMLIIPAAAARFWTERLPRMMVIAAALGAASGWLGATLSALVDDLPTGAIIVLVAAAAFGVSMLLGVRRGVVPRLLRHVALRRAVGRQHILRALYEIIEARGETTETGSALEPIALPEIEAKRSWSARCVLNLLADAEDDGLIIRLNAACRFTHVGLRAATRVVRNHRLWEMYLITHADIAPSHVDRDADMVEHVLGPEMVAKLERLLEQATERPVPVSPHALDAQT